MHVEAADIYRNTTGRVSLNILIESQRQKVLKDESTPLSNNKVNYLPLLEWIMNPIKILISYGLYYEFIKRVLHYSSLPPARGDSFMQRDNRLGVSWREQQHGSIIFHLDQD